VCVCSGMGMRVACAELPCCCAGARARLAWRKAVSSIFVTRDELYYCVRWSLRLLVLLLECASAVWTVLHTTLVNSHVLLQPSRHHGRPVEKLWSPSDRRLQIREQKEKWQLEEAQSERPAAGRCAPHDLSPAGQPISFPASVTSLLCVSLLARCDFSSWCITGIGRVFLVRVI
jgi:hypothetical protein